MIPLIFWIIFRIYLSHKKIITTLSRDEITILQSSFVKEQFRENNKLNLFPVIEDIILFHGALNRSLYAGPYTGESRSSFNDDTLLKISSGTIFFTLKYNYDDLMTVGELTLDEFLVHHRPEKTYVVIYNCGGVVKPLIINKPLGKLLQALTGGNSLNKLFSNNPSIDKAEVYEFIEYALAETIIYIE